MPRDQLKVSLKFLTITLTAFLVYIFWPSHLEEFLYLLSLIPFTVDQKILLVQFWRFCADFIIGIIYCYMDILPVYIDPLLPVYLEYFQESCRFKFFVTSFELGFLAMVTLLIFYIFKYKK